MNKADAILIESPAYSHYVDGFSSVRCLTSVQSAFNILVQTGCMMQLFLCPKFRNIALIHQVSYFDLLTDTPCAGY